MSDIERKKEKITLEILREKVKNKNFDSDDFKSYWRQKQKENDEFLSLLDWACEIKNNDGDLQKLLIKTGLSQASDIMQKLRDIGFALKKDLGESFEKSAYRLLEQTRAGKRNDVMYGVIRIFVAHQKAVPEILNEAFKPYYAEETFQCFIYAFLGSVIKSKENKKEE
ncbi:MAG: hypothetical protein KBG82_08540 [Spirochaetes bacterium]|nr:hypothetical protein [Spirochaetota bacterium]